ncbi:MAG: RING finger domain-containing protein, partial [Myxococcota bacterium]
KITLQYELQQELRSLRPTPSSATPSQEVCSICLSTLSLGKTCQVRCGHTFHQHCLLQILEQNNHKCPLCRAPLLQKKTEPTSWFVGWELPSFERWFPARPSHADSMQVLTEMFPRSSVVELEQLLEQHGGYADLVVEHLLSTGQGQ